jgi:C-terminal processing protease CtpA/Prc
MTLLSIKKAGILLLFFTVFVIKTYSQHPPAKDSTEYTPDPAVDATLPLIILTNNFTPSASELLTGAVQENVEYTSVPHLDFHI